MTPDAISNFLGHLRYHWGKDFVAHLLACDASELDNPPLTPERLKVMSKLAGLMSGEGIGAAFSDRRALSIADHLVQYDADLMCTLATNFYISCGGTMPRLESEDATEHSLLRLAADAAFPALLFEETEEKFTSKKLLAMKAISSHPEEVEFVQCLQNRSETLRNLFDDRLPTETSEWKYETLKGIETYLTWSDGSVGLITVGQLSISILFATSTTMTSAGLLSSYLSAVRQALAVARTMASFKRCRAIAHVGLSNISLSQDVEMVQLSSGKLRRPTALDVLPHRSIERSFRHSIEPHLTILETHIDLQLEEASGTRWKKQQIDHPELGSKIDLSRLSLLFSSDSDELISPTQAFSFVNIPISSLGLFTTNPFRWPYFAHGFFKIDTSVASRVEQWSRDLDQLPSGLFLGMRRL